MVELDFPARKAVREAQTNQIGNYDHRLSVDQRITLLLGTFQTISIGDPFPRDIYDEQRKKDIHHRLSEKGLMNWSPSRDRAEVTVQGKKVALEILKEIDEEKYEQAQSEILAGSI